MDRLLLDTCAVIFIAEGTPMTSQAQGQIRAASIAGLILVSPISAWEVGLLSAKNRFPFRPDPLRRRQLIMSSDHRQALNHDFLKNNQER